LSDVISSNLLAKALAHVSISCFLPTHLASTSFILHNIFFSLSFTNKSLGTESIVTAHNSGFREATMIESAKYHQACDDHQNHAIKTFTFPNSSLIMSCQRLLLTMVTVHLAIADTAT
jgi:hypothetical protein